jgi:hypothetical protein
MNGGRRARGEFTKGGHTYGGGPKTEKIIFFIRFAS